MLLEQTHFPLGKNDGPGLGTMIVVAILLVGVGVVAYNAFKPEVIMPQPKKTENENTTNVV